MANSIVVNNLCVKRDGNPIILDLSFEIRKGSIAGILGPSGSGKTTIFRAIVGVQEITSGKITVLGKPAGSKDLRNRIGYLTQSASIYADLTVSENLRYFSKILGTSEISVDEIIDLVDLGKNIKQLASTLSGGERARLALATALLGKPDVIILDEPTVGLDPLLRIELWKVFRFLGGQGKTLLLSSHSMDEADLCDSLVLLREGKILAQGSPAQLKSETGETQMESVFISLVKKP